MFKFRPGGQGASSPSQPPNIEALRRSARHRLIGASVLVLAGVLGFPLLFDSQPRPIPVDIPIEIPAKNAVKPLGAVQEHPVAAAVRLEGLDAKEEVLPVVAAPTLAAASSSEPVKAADKSPVQAPDKPVAKAAPATTELGSSKPAVEQPRPGHKAEAKSDTRTEAKVDSKASAKTDIKDNQRLVVQVGAFADAARASEVRQKLERAGLKTYVHVADTPEGKRTRVRLGPFATRAEADKAAARAKALGLSGNILAL